MRIHHALLVGAGLVLLSPMLAGCGEDSVQAFRDPGADPLAGEYVSDGPVRLFPDGSEPIRLTLIDGEISFAAGCNRFSGKATWDDGVLRTSGLGGTEMGCLDNGLAQDQWMVEFFGSSPTLELDGSDLALGSGKDRVWFVPADEVPSGELGGEDDLLGTRWRLTGIGEHDGDSIGMMVIPDDVTATIRFEGDEFSLDTGCNTGGGPAAIGADTIRLGELEQTTALCPGPQADVERGVARVLQGKTTVSWSISGDELRLRSSDGRHELIYHR